MDLQKIRMHEDTIKRIDAAMNKAKSFLDNKAYFRTEKGEELLTTEQLNTLREAEVKAIQDCAQ